MARQTSIIECSRLFDHSPREAADMADVLLHHHIQGLTDGVRAFADDLRAGGHTVHTPDLFEGRTFAAMQEGFDFSQQVDGDALADAAAAELPEGLVYAGF